MSGLYCIHGHFYQPAREHPWLDAVEVEDAAAPAHDWNERITAECYAPNAAARILDAEGRIVRIVNNYDAISFNVGPTLLRWMERHAPGVHAQIVGADRRSLAARGFGNALAQPYAHAILPLATAQDKMTLVRWGIADFRRRFGRLPDGMWLPETAVDLETLAVLAQCGIGFTVLAPHQAARVRALPSGEWVDVAPPALDGTRPYLCRPAPDLRIALFFYDGPTSRELAFGRLLENGEALAHRLRSLAGDAELARDRLVHVATDGETFGHHHRFGEMALAYAVEFLEGRAGGQTTNYATFLADHPPTHEVEIHERTAWSCAHGLERWRADCGCRTRSEWHQRWRAPLRDAMDWLKGEVDALFEEAGGRIFHEPWAARDAYIDVALDPSEGSVARFLKVQALRPSITADRREALRLLEMQRHALLMLASDGWFFDELSGPEAVQNLRRAGRALQLAAHAGRDLEAPFLERLRPAESNLSAYRDGAAVYERLVRPAFVDARRVAAHVAITSLFVDAAGDPRLYAYRVARREVRRLTRGTHTLMTGRVEVGEAATGEADLLSFAVLHFGGSDVHCCVAAGWDDGTHAAAVEALTGTYEGGTVTEVIRHMDETFGRQFFTIRDLFTEERRQILARLSAETVASLESSYRRLYHENRGLMETLRDADVPVPREFLMAAEFILLTDLRRALAAPGALAAAAWDLVGEARTWGLALTTADLEVPLRTRIEERLRDAAGLFVVENLEEVLRSLDFARDVGITVNLWQTQNLFHVLHAPRLAEADGRLRDVVEQVADRLYFSLESLRAAASGKIDL